MMSQPFSPRKRFLLTVGLAWTLAFSANSHLFSNNSQKPFPFDFQHDIGGILTRWGCNSAECHGSVKGEGGFKLSLNALYPREDYRWILEGGTYQVLSAEPAGKMQPRIDLEDPAESRLLLKATGRLGHDGGELFGEQTRDYQWIHRWIEAGAPYSQPGSQARRVTRIDVAPSELVLEPAASAQLRITAHLADGSQRDFTTRVRYETNNREVATVSIDGKVTSFKPGETDILVHTAGHSVTLRVGVIKRARRIFSDIPPTNFIDQHVFDKLERFHIIPSAISSDSEFLRRVCLDVTGTLPPPNRVREFLADRDPQKRKKLIDALIESPEYVDYWVLRFADLFRVKNSTAYWEWVRRSIARNKPYDQIAHERIAATGFEGPSRYYSSTSKARPIERVVSEDMRVFLGRRFDCAQCHDHPFEPWTQDQFWGLASFYGRLTLTEWIGPTDNQVVFDDPDGTEVDFGMNGVEELQFIKVTHPRKKFVVEPTFLDGTPLAPEARDDARAALADWVTSHPYFAEAIVNRMWSRFFGRGIVDPVDDFGSDNPPSHPKLLEELAVDFRDHGHDLKRLMKLIVSSRAYQRSSVPNASNRDDHVNFSHALPRPLDAEVLLDAIATLTGVPVDFQHDLPFEVGVIARAPRGTRAVQLAVPASFLSRFLEIYDRPFRDVVPERSTKPNLTQALHMLAGSTYSDHIAREGGRIDALLDRGAENREVIEEFYLAAFARFPTAEEIATLEEKLPPITDKKRRSTLQNLLWALMASREFATNH